MQLINGRGGYSKWVGETVIGAYPSYDFSSRAFVHTRFDHPNGTRMNTVWEVNANNLDAKIHRQIEGNVTYVRTQGGLDYWVTVSGTTSLSVQNGMYVNNTSYRYKVH
jgi:hypothetical protein